MATTEATLTLLIHGEPGAGKTPVALTGPRPTLVLDVEGGTEHAAPERVMWDPAQEKRPPTADVVAVSVQDWTTYQRVLDYLEAGRHPFESIVLDSLSELQKRCQRTLVSPDQVMAERQWGILLSRMEDGVRRMTDLRRAPDQPVRCVCFVTLTDEVKRMRRPMVQGSLRMSLPAMVDVVGFLAVRPDETGAASPKQRGLLIQPTDDTVAKDRTSGRAGCGLTHEYGAWVRGPIDLNAMLGVLTHQREAQHG